MANQLLEELVNHPYTNLNNTIAMASFLQGFNPRNSYILALLTLAFTVGEISRYLLGALSMEMAKDIGFGDKGCYRIRGTSASSLTTANFSTSPKAAAAECNRFANNLTCSSARASETGGIGDQPVCEWVYNGQGMDYLILVGTYFIVMFTVSGIVMGYFADKLHRPRLLAACVALFSICGTSMGLATQYWHLVALRLGIATGEAALRPAGGSLIAELFDVETRGKANGIFSWGIYFGIGLTFTLGNFAAPAAAAAGSGWRFAFILGCSPGIILALLLAFLPETRPKRRCTDPTYFKDGRQRMDVKSKVASVIVKASGTNSDSINKATTLERESQYWKTVLKTLCQSEMILLLMAATIRQAGGLTWAFNTQLFFNENFPGYNPGLWLTVCTILGGTLGLFFGGYLSDLAVRTMGLHSRLWILSFTLFIASPLSIGVLSIDPPYTFAFLLLYYFFAETWFGVLFTVIVEVVPQNVRSVVIAIFLFLMNNIGGQIPLAVDPLQKAYGLRQALLMIWPGCIGMCAFMFLVASLPLWIKRRKGSAHRPR